MLNSLQNPLALIGRLLLALLFVPAGFSKIAGFSGTVGYIASKGVPLPSVAAAIAIVVELGLGILLAVGFQTRWAALARCQELQELASAARANWRRLIPESIKEGMARSVTRLLEPPPVDRESRDAELVIHRSQ